MSKKKGIIELEEGWGKEIVPKAINVLLNILDSGLDKAAPFPPNTFMPIYTICYNMCTQCSPHNFSEQLYERHGETFTKYLQGSVLPSLQHHNHTSDDVLLKELRNRWMNHKVMNKWMSRFFMYLDRYYVQHHSLPSLSEAGLTKFKEIVFTKIKKSVVQAILMLVDKERDGEVVDTTLLRDCIEVFEAMGGSSTCSNNLTVYMEDFEEELIKRSVVYYETKAQKWLSADSTPDYLLKAEKSLSQESVRVEKYMHSSTEPKLLQALETILLQKHQQQLLEKEKSGCLALLEMDKKEDLHRMYELFSRIPDGLVPMATLVRKHIQSVGCALVSQRKSAIATGNVKDVNVDPGFVKDLLRHHDHFSSLVVNVLGGHSLFQKSLKEAFVEFVNQDSSPKYTNAELLATFTDRILKTGGEKLSDQQVEEYLEKVVSLFGYLSDKDLFAEIYRNLLAKRLLNQRSASSDLEITMIGKLKLRCGAQFTGKMEGMMNDLSIGADHQHGFETYLKKGNSKDLKLNMEFGVQVLTTGHWPTYKALELNMPSDMVKCMTVFKAFYDSQTSHRRLTWVYILGNSTIKSKFKKGYFDLQLTTLQAVALLLFQSKDTMSFEELRESLNLSKDIVKKILHSLSCGKYKILTKSPPGSQISQTDIFTFNMLFTCPKRKIRVPMASLEESHNPKHVEDDRFIAIEAAIVRIMKARKTLQHSLLVAEVVAQLSFFKPSVKVIKKRIEALIDREYLERDPDAGNSVYRYLA